MGTKRFEDRYLCMFPELHCFGLIKQIHTHVWITLNKGNLSTHPALKLFRAKFKCRFASALHTTCVSWNCSAGRHIIESGYCCDRSSYWYLDDLRLSTPTLWALRMVSSASRALCAACCWLHLWIKSSVLTWYAFRILKLLLFINIKP